MSVLNSAEYFYNSVTEIINGNENYNKSFKLLFAKVKEFLDFRLESEKQYFSSFYAKLVFVIDKFQIPKNLANSLFHFNKINSKLKSKQNQIEIGSDELFQFALCFCRFISLTSNSEIPDNLAKLAGDDIIQLEQSILPQLKKKELFESFVVTVEKKGMMNISKRVASLHCQSDDFGDLTIFVKDEWSEIWQIARKGDRIQLFNIHILNAEKRTFITTKTSLVVVEPDYLVDATEIAECFSNEGSNVNIHFLKKFQIPKFKIELLTGSFVNTVFDELVNDENKDFEDIYESAIKQKPLTFFVLAKGGSEFTKELRAKVHFHYKNLRQHIQLLDKTQFSIEPSFFSPQYGLQGRLDLLLEYQDEKLRKNVIELKSGKPPGINLMYMGDGRPYKTGIWQNNIAQITCYNLLLDSTFKDRTGTSSILYSSITNAYDEPLRNSPNLVSSKKDVIRLRNWIFAIERAISLRHFNIFNQLTSEQFGPIPPFNKANLVQFENAYSNLSEIERNYFNEMVSFISREIFTEKIGTYSANGKSGFASIWLDSTEEKFQNYSVITNLQINIENSDFDKLYLYFNCENGNNENKSFRKGDIAVLYSIGEDGSPNILNHPVIRCYIKEIAGSYILLSLRNKHINPDFYNENIRWGIEPDYIETTNRGLYQSLARFLFSLPEKRNILLGIEAPGFNEIEKVNCAELNQLQNELLNKAIAAENYFLLQGPPGTGKTSYFLKNIARYYYENSEDNILVLAYTNRAVDEICNSLLKLEGVMFLRLGSKDSTSNPDVTVSYLAEHGDFRELYKRFSKTRIIVSTVASVLSNQELFLLKNFRYAIIDEATQILEPQIVGILTQVEKFVMIGDEKQLPAVLLQSQQYLKIEDEELQKFNLCDLSSSIFERLLKCCKQNGWDENYGMLREQARMHVDLQELANNLFYDNKLMPFANNNWQNSDWTAFKTKPKIKLSEIEKNYYEIISSSNLIFIDSPIEKASKINEFEAETVSGIISTIAKLEPNFDENYIGVITPFRAQCNKISEKLNPEIRNKIVVDTVERFQGSERETIIISYAVNYPLLLKNVQSLVQIDGKTVDRKLNVAITRAKKQLIILGSEKILGQSEIFTDLINYIKINGRFFSW